MRLFVLIVIGHFSREAPPALVEKLTPGLRLLTGFAERSKCVGWRSRKEQHHATDVAVYEALEAAEIHEQYSFDARGTCSAAGPLTTASLDELVEGRAIVEAAGVAA